MAIDTAMKRFSMLNMAIFIQKRYLKVVVQNT